MIRREAVTHHYLQRALQVSGCALALEEAMRIPALATCLLNTARALERDDSQRLYLKLRRHFVRNDWRARLADD